MTEQERKALAESLVANPLFHALFDDMEKSATEACIWAADDESRRFAAMRVQAIINLRTDCAEALRSTPDRKGAPA